jgi:hypothetical protein
MKEEEGGGFGHMGVAQPPPDLPVWWWLSHPHGLGVANHPLWVDRPPFFISVFFFFTHRGGRNHPLGHGGGSATTKPASHPYGWIGHQGFFFFLSFFF